MRNVVLYSYLLGELTVLINVANLFTAEVCGGFSTATAVNGGVRVPSVVMAVACRQITLEHRVVLSGPV